MFLWMTLLPLKRKSPYSRISCNPAGSRNSLENKNSKYKYWQNSLYFLKTFCEPICVHMYVHTLANLTLLCILLNINLRYVGYLTSYYLAKVKVKILKSSSVPLRLDVVCMLFMKAMMCFLGQNNWLISNKKIQDISIIRLSISVLF